jgi:hypothetical protein
MATPRLRLTTQAALLVLVKVAPLLAMVADWRALLNSSLREEEVQEFRAHGRTGSPLGDEAFVDRLEETAGRAIRFKTPGRPLKLLKHP